MPFSVVVLVPAVEPIVMAVVEPARPPVPRLIVLVLPEEVAPAWMSVVWETVDRPNVMLLVEEVPPIAIVPEEIRATVAVLDVAKALDVVIVPVAEMPDAPTVPVNVGFTDRATEPVPVLSAKSVKPKSQPAAVVTVVSIQTIWIDKPGIMVAIRLPPDEFIVRLLVLLLRMKYAEPSTSVLVTGITTVCVVLPVKKIVLGLALVSVVVPAAVAILVKPKSMLLTANFWLALRSTTLFAPEEAVTPVPPLATPRTAVPAAIVAPS